MNAKNTVIEDAVDRAENESYDLRWDCDDCEAETPHDLVDETETDEGAKTYIDTRMACNECGTVNEVSDAR